MDKVPSLTHMEKAREWLHENTVALFGSVGSPTLAASLASLLAAEHDAALEKAAELVRTWADDHLTIQPSFPRMVAAIRAMKGASDE